MIESYDTAHYSGTIIVPTVLQYIDVPVGNQELFSLVPCTYIGIDIRAVADILQLLSSR